MSIALPLLFSLVGVASVAAIWHAIVTNMDAVRDLRRLVGLPDHGAGVVVTFRDHAAGYDSVSMVRRPRQLRVPAPKPVTHRLHHFAKARTAA
jgi:hypothetical protein